MMPARLFEPSFVQLLTAFILSGTWVTGQLIFKLIMQRWSLLLRVQGIPTCDT
ncbi:hypothetical protein LINGRAHAP2_LOCUS35587 [Linum grandiflorum]